MSTSVLGQEFNEQEVRQRVGDLLAQLERPATP
jgi:hypothetical protein